MTDKNTDEPRIAATEIDPLRIAHAVAKRLSGGPLNLLPCAATEPLAFFGGSGFGDDPPAPFAVNEGVGVVSIKGILLQEAFDLCGFEMATGYDRIVANARAAALSSEVTSGLLTINSPGGMAIGNLEAAEEIRSIFKDAGKPLAAFVTSASSAAYALACAASEILCMPSAALGCIGTIAGRLDISGALASAGLREIVAAWPPGKAVQSETGATPEDVRAYMMGEVKPLAELFMGHVAARRSMNRAAVFALDARTLIGAEAVAAGLADRVVSEREAIAHTRSKAGVNRKVYSMADTKEAAPSAAEKLLASLMSAVGLAGVLNPTAEQIGASVALVTADRMLASKVRLATGLTSDDESADLVSTWKRSATETLPATREKLKMRTVQLAVSTGRMTPGQAYASDQDVTAREFPAAPALAASLVTRSLEAVELEINGAAPHPATLPPPKPRRIAHPEAAGATQKDAERAGFKGPNAVADYQAYLLSFGSRRAGGKDIDE